MKKLSLILLPLFALLASSGCSSIPIKDVKLFWPMGPDGALITHTLTDAEGRFTKEEWDAQASRSVCLGYDDFGHLRATIEKLCSEHKGLCKKEVEAKVYGFAGRTRVAARKSRREK